MNPMALFRRTKPPDVEDMPKGTTKSVLDPRSAGDLLRQRREELGLDLGDVAAALRIKPAYLAALEAGRPDRLPGPAYAIGFVRAYGDHLGLDGREILRRFKEESSALATKPDLSFPMPLGERSLPGGGTLLVALILAFCSYGAWYYLSTGERSRPERVTEVPAALLSPRPEQPPTEAAAPRSSTALAGSRVAAPAAEAFATPGSVNPEPGSTGAPAATAGVPLSAPPLALPATVPSAAPPTAPSPSENQTAAIAPAQPPPQSEEPRPSGIADGATRIVIRATADSWVQIRDANQSVLLTRVLKAGETYPVPSRPGVSMRTGNAGGLEITVDGNPAPPIGRMGAIRNVALEPQALIAGTAVFQ
jgi:cytoskeleton protein RodZ